MFPLTAKESIENSIDQDKIQLENQLTIEKRT